MNVILVDLLSNSPPYSSALVNALRLVGLHSELAAITVHFDRDYYSRNNTPLLSGIVDIVSRMGIKKQSLRRALKAVEYHVNLPLLLLKCLLLRPRIVHIMWLPFLEYAPFDMLFVRCLKMANIKVAYTVHNLMPHECRRNSEIAYSGIYRLADALICHTEGSRSCLIDRFGIDKAKIAVVPHGPLTLNGLEEPSGDIAALLRLAERAQVKVLLFGTIRPYKGLEFLLDVWKKVSEIDTDCMLVIAGNGDSSYTRQLALKIEENGIESSVLTHFSYLSDGDLSALINSCDVLVYPYRQITQSGALSLGMAAGKAIVVSKVGGFSETIQHGQNGMVAEYGDINGFSEAILDLIRDPVKRGTIAHTAKTQKDAEVSWKSIAQKTAAVYSSLATK